MDCFHEFVSFFNYLDPPGGNKVHVYWMFLSKKFVEVLTWRPIREKRTERGNIENLQGHCT